MQKTGKIVVTGGAGFIGSHLVDRLVSEGNDVVAIDNLASGRLEFLARSKGKPNFKFVKADLLKPEQYSAELAGAKVIYHLAANPDIKAAITNTRIEVDQGVLSTYNLLEQARKKDVPSIVFSSSSVVYGEPRVVPVPEDYGPATPISLYGASKLAGEGFLSAYCGTFGMKGIAYRFANVVGARATHGVIYDFSLKLREDPGKLEVLGDGLQTKSYILVEECVDAMLFGASKRLGKMPSEMEVYNIANRDWVSVAEIAKQVIAAFGYKGTKISFTGGARGWPGDVPKVMLDGAKLAKLGWKPKLNSLDTVKAAAKIIWKETGA
ncbi:MAG: NAD-dependent epimerase/dehydratase family protein [Candidatus Micrarchaeia archaeon]